MNYPVKAFNFDDVLTLLKDGYEHVIEMKDDLSHFFELSINIDKVYVNGKYITAYNIHSIFVKHEYRSGGSFKKFLSNLESMGNVVIHDVINSSLEKHLLDNGYTILDNDKRKVNLFKILEYLK